MFNCTMVLPYYNAGQLLEWNLQLWSSYSNDIKQCMEYIIVDDGSKDDPAIQHINANKLNEQNVPIRLFVIEKDKPWNSEGANNLGLSYVQTDRVLRMDFDYHFPEEELRKVLSIDLKENEWYNFNVIKYKTNEQLMSHFNTFFMMKDTFWKSGGYDEDFCGNYGWTDIFLERTFARYAKQHIRKDINLVTCPYDSSHSLERDGTINKQLLEEKTKELANLTDYSKDIIRFEWQEILL